MTSESPTQQPDPTALAEVLSVSISGSANAYTFNVEVKSPDTGCDQYANWWEVLDTNGELKYRRILAHSHVNEQPFKRSGGAINIAEDEVVWIRAHMNNTGYGVKALKGSVKDGFQEDTLDATFAEELAKQDPLPGDCPF